MKVDSKVFLISAAVITAIATALFFEAAFLYVAGPVTGMNYLFNNGVAKFRWQTRFPARTRIEYGTSLYSLNSLDVSKDYLSSHTLGFLGILPDKKHFFRVVTEAENGRTYATKFYVVK